MKNILIIEENRQASGEKLLNEIKNLITCPIGGYWIHIKRDEESNKIREFDLVSLYSKEKGNIFFRTNDSAGIAKFNIDIFNTKGVEFLQDGLNHGEVLIFNEIGYLESKAEKFTKEVIRALNSEKVVIALLKKVNCDYINYIATRKDVNIFNVSEDNKIYAKEGIIKLLKEWRIPMSTTLDEIIKLKPVLWINSKLMKSEIALENVKINIEEMYEAEARLERFAALIKRLFPETIDGIIESPLLEVENMKESLEKYYDIKINGKLYLKCDSHLKVAGSVKARGGIYEVLKYAEALCIENGMLTKESNYSIMAEINFKDFFSKYTIAVGSTGNLGLSIGIISRALGFNTVIHMSKDAKEWKKKLLREKGAIVIEYEEDYSKAVEEGRKQCNNDPKAYFIDDENSKDLFYGYTTAALRLKKQLEEQNIVVDKEHELYIYLPCGVGGAPGGITYGIKALFGDNAHCYFVEPTHSPCMLLGLITEKFSKLHVRDFGIDNVTEADGLAVGSPSEFISNIAKELIEGEYTIEDEELFRLLALLKQSEDLKVEPSAAAGLLGTVLIKGDNTSTHIAWATGGLFLPENIYLQFYEKGKSLLNK